MYIANQSNTQVYSLFGTYVVEQHDDGFDAPRADIRELSFAPLFAPRDGTCECADSRKAA